MANFPYPDSVPDGFLWQYGVIIRPKGRVTHEWSLKNENGGIHVHCWIVDYPGPALGPSEWLGGIECHWAKKPPSYGDWFSSPSHEHCWLLEGPCWHDGSSLYFSERIAPLLPDPIYSKTPNAMEDRHHGYVLSELISWHRDKIEAEFAEPVE